MASRFSELNACVRACVVALRCMSHYSKPATAAALVEAGTQVFMPTRCKHLRTFYNTIQYNTKFVKRHVAWLQRRWRTGQLRSIDGGEQMCFKSRFK